MSRSGTLLLLTITITFSLHAQDVYFSGNGQSLVYLNPSFAGTNGFIRSQSLYRVQDYNNKAAFRSFYTGVDAYLRPIKGGLAITLLNDDQARSLLKTTSVGITYAQHIFVKQKKVRIVPAIQVVRSTRLLETSRIQIGDTIDFRKNYTWRTPQPAQGSKNFIDFNSSILFQNKDASFGFAFFHINQPNEGMTEERKLPMRMSIHAAANYKLNSELSLAACGVFITQDNFWDFNLNLNLWVNNELFFGIGLRKVHAVMTSLGFRNDIFRLSIGYDYGVNKDERNIYGNNTLEIMLSLNLQNTKSENAPTGDWVTW